MGLVPTPQVKTPPPSVPMPVQLPLPTQLNLLPLRLGRMPMHREHPQPVLAILLMRNGKGLSPLVIWRMPRVRERLRSAQAVQQMLNAQWPLVGMPMPRLKMQSPWGIPLMHWQTILQQLAHRAPFHGFWCDSTAAIGTSAIATGINSTAIGLDASVSGKNSVALGRKAITDGTNSTAIGSLSKAKGNQSVAIGRGATTSLTALGAIKC